MESLYSTADMTRGVARGTHDDSKETTCAASTDARDNGEPARHLLAVAAADLAVAGHPWLLALAPSRLRGNMGSGHNVIRRISGSALRGH